MDESRLCRELAPRIRAYGLKHLRDEQKAADLVQEVLIVTLEALRDGRLREPDHIASFALGTSRLMVKDGLRGERRRAALLAQVVLENVEPAQILDEKRLRECLQQLAERERTVVVLSYYADKSAREIGGELGLSDENVRVVRHRALARLSDCVGGEA